jgi:hypothetical protein
VPSSFFKTLAGKLFAINDGNFDRAAMGNLDDYTGPNGVDSPAQYGFRAIDGQGNAIFDSMGLIAVMTQPGGSTHVGVQSPISSLTYVLIPGTPVSFMLKRQTTIFAMGTVTGAASLAGAGHYAYATIFVDGAKPSIANEPRFANASGQSLNGLTLASVVLGAGTHIVDLRGLTDSAAGGQVFNIDSADLYVFQLGS